MSLGISNMESLNATNKVCMIINTLNGKVLIGKAYNVMEMFEAQREVLKAQMHTNTSLQLDYNNAGGDGFVFGVLDNPSEFDSLAVSCRKLVNKYNAMNREYGYNFKNDGFIGIFNKLEYSRKKNQDKEGEDPSPEFLEIMKQEQIEARDREVVARSERMKGVQNALGSTRTPEQRAEQSARMMGHEVSDETKGRMSKAASGRVMPGETKEKIAASVSESIAKKHYEMIDFMQNTEIEKSPFA